MKADNAVTAVLLSIFMIASTLSAQEGAGSGEIVSVSGTVEILSSGEGEYRPAEEDGFVGPDDIVRTGSDSSIEIAFDEDGENVVRLESGTEAAFKFAKDEKLELIKGEVLATVASLAAGSSFEIRTPAAVSGARGTDWITTVDDEGTSIEALDGSPYVKEFDASGRLLPEETVVARGYMTRVRRFERPAAPSAIPEKRREHLEKKRVRIKENVREVIRKRKEQPGMRRRDERMIEARKKKMRMSGEPPRKPLQDGSRPQGNVTGPNPPKPQPKKPLPKPAKPAPIRPPKR